MRKIGTTTGIKTVVILQNDGLQPDAYVLTRTMAARIAITVSAISDTIRPLLCEKTRVKFKSRTEHILYFKLYFLNIRVYSKTKQFTEKTNLYY